MCNCSKCMSYSNSNDIEDLHCFENGTKEFVVSSSEFSCKNFIEQECSNCSLHNECLFESSGHGPESCNIYRSMNRSIACPTIETKETQK